MGRAERIRLEGRSGSAVGARGGRVAFLACAPALLFDALEHTFSYAFTAALVLVLDTCAFHVKHLLRGFECCVLFELVLNQKSRALEGERVDA